MLRDPLLILESVRGSFGLCFALHTHLRYLVFITYFVVSWYDGVEVCSSERKKIVGLQLKEHLLSLFVCRYMI
jgi:hypothetical protein